MKIGSLFSGVGGLELGLEWSGLGETVWQVEIDEFCRSVLAKHWPAAERHSDVRFVGARNLTPVDLICGGFPCQDVSSAGNRAGLAGRRSGLWAEFSRVVSELRPEWVVVENVASGAKLWVDAVCAELGQLGYATLPVPLSAEDVGAPHKRARIFIVARKAVADSDGNGQPAIGVGRVVTGQHREDGPACGYDTHGRSGARPWPPGAGDLDAWAEWIEYGGPEPALRRGPDGLPCGMAHAEWERLLTVAGNSVVPQCAEVIGHLILATAGAQ